jgi:uncharacterized protein (DUF2236 family)
VPALADAAAITATSAPVSSGVRPLASHEEERHYRETAIVGRLVGTPASVIPASLADFREYMRAQLSGPDLVRH